MTTNELGWSDDVTGQSGKLSHYYVNGKSLCGRWELKSFMKTRNPEMEGSKYCMNCMKCEAKRKKLINQ